MSEPIASRIATEVRRHRTFAIVSHPDAGKPTLTPDWLERADEAVADCAVTAA